jgi:hypothetical protein
VNNKANRGTPIGPPKHQGLAAFVAAQFGQSKFSRMPDGPKGWRQVETGGRHRLGNLFFQVGRHRRVCWMRSEQNEEFTTSFPLRLHGGPYRKCLYGVTSIKGDGGPGHRDPEKTTAILK